jgi:CubicO group peptidase (beta-lactamase class C family)
MPPRIRILILALLSAASLLGEVGKPLYPRDVWSTAKPESAGYSSPRLEALRAYLKTLDTSAMMVVRGGQVVFEYGDPATVSYLASCRKSILAMLYGKYVENGKIDLNKTLADLDMDDIGGLQPIEKQATVEHLIAARSGVFHPASNAGDLLASAPPRGSQRPGTYQLYSNWDFNAAGAAFEKMTGLDIYDALEADLAKPISMQDFDRAKHRKDGNLTKSRYPAYHMHLSTRDMSRVGYLMLRNGNWNGRQLVPRDWIRRITSLVTPMYDMNPPSARGYATGQLWGYGYMWWVWDDHRREGPFAGAYTARGALGQYITVLPTMDTVIAHKTVPAEPGGRVRDSSRYYQSVLQLVAGAYCGTQCN